MTWYCIRTSPQREFALAGSRTKDGEPVLGILTRKGYDVFCPVDVAETRSKKKSGKRKRVFYPKFRGYVFIKAPFDFDTVRAERHVLDFVRYCSSDGYPAPIADHEIALLQLQTVAVTAHKSIKPHQALRVGRLAEITDGPLAGHRVTITGLNGTKARVFQKLFGTEREIEVSQDSLEAA